MNAEQAVDIKGTVKKMRETAARELAFHCIVLTYFLPYCKFFVLVNTRFPMSKTGLFL